MPEPQKHTIDADDWRLALLAIKRDILDPEPVAALRPIDAMLDQIGWCDDDVRLATRGIKSRHD
jgi:hypothetical protein